MSKGVGNVEGIFITMEGPDGSGKTTALQSLASAWEKQTGKEIIMTREPGGSPIAEKIRALILDPSHTEMDGRTEALLYAASRRQHLVEKILPALEAGKVVLCDRFVDSSIAYQGFAREIGTAGIQTINDFATGGLQPQLTLYIDVPSEVGLERIRANRHSEEINRLDQEALTFHKRVRAGYQQLAEQFPQRIVRIDGTQSKEAVAADCLQAVRRRFPGFFHE